MARIRLLLEGEVPADVQIHFQRDRAAYGAVLESTATYAYCPPILAASKAMSAAVERSGHLSRQLKRLLNLRIAGMVGCPS